ncbi:MULTISPECIES: Ig-like domain-containing protein [unclassified Paenibacillus]|uniref:Ig-like domain-containing protein n=1 Tax=unclassified Paenibacillus TaxID=185978 RepID=UPI0024074B7A|nr:MULTISPECIES: Ig-like domain-containing protein [unclassified Paenibacillus]MDF9840125.1 putative repeat protein (TIGR02059 family) [Paenibacillus sp. PastF-2]MDF9846707.1 putative repeat protein (TIGR02059 family) [Paenibacillus sp. PastM-2]MDF9852944.1 putative repeat protein (TIGR02059 family) [Paenibacillus sp. PastF-1]MDH6478551.1 putative repeat protein (TIGR02059 family) [Paenibacillus sp. PastH-2]MDH6505951.1 putative repeat protein (TIGR02059 family) [Paenibacillus sp. PastM-3]
MKRKISIWTALILAGNLLFSTGYPSIGIGSQTAHAANEFNVGISPAEGEKNVNISSNIKLSFDRLVSPQSGNITVTAQGANEPYVTIPVGSSGLISSSTEYQVKLGKELEYNKTYTVNVPKGMFKDNLGLESLAATATFTTAPSINTAITATEYSPANYSRVDSSLTQLSLKLNKKLQKGGGSIKLIASADNSVVQEFKIKDGESYAYLQNDTSNSTTTVILTLANKLTAGSSYYVLIDPYALQDDDNKSYAGITTGNVWSFSVKGSVVPGITVSPANGAGAVSVSTGIQLTFDQPMMPATGNITVSPSNTAYARAFDVKSASVTGGGTRFISITAASAANPLLSNTQYTVTIPQGAFYDQDGNVFPASGPYTWSFTTTSLTGFGITSLSPADRSEAVQISQPIKIAFNQATTLTSANGVALYKSNGTKLSTTISPSADLKEFTIVPSAGLDNDTIYYVDIAQGTFVGSSNNPFEGINGRNAWSFKTVALDKTAPVLSSASLENNRTIRLKYDEALNAGISLMLGSFAVTVNEEKRNIDSTYIQGDSVYVTLSTGVAVGQVIRISYTQGIRMIEDLSGNAAVSYAGRTVTNNIQSVLPTPRDGTLSGKTLVLNFNDQLRTASAAGYSQFYVYADGVSLGVNSMSSSGSSVTLGLNNVASSVQSVRVTYYAGSYPLQDQYGQNIANFSDFYVRNTSDTVAPVFQSASGSDKQIILTYNEGLSANSLPLVSQYSVLVGSTPNYVTNVAVSGNQVTLTLASALSTGGYTTVSYIPGIAGISDLNGNRAAYINLQPVSVSGSSVTTVPNISSATITGDELTVNFSKSMQASSTLYSGQFAVRVDGSTVGVQSVNVSGTTMRLVLSTVVRAGQTVDLSYMTGAGSILDLSGTALASFTALAVQNLTGTGASTSSRPSYLGILAASEFGKEYPLLKSDSATTADDRSVYNQAVKRYVLAADRLTASYEYLQKLGTASLVFEVPQTELAAYVTVPLKPLLDAVNRNSKSAFGIRYGDTLYNLALDDMNMNSLAAGLIADSSTISLVIRLEKVPSGTYTPFEQKLRSQGLQTVTSLTDIRMSAVVSGNYSNGTVLSSPGEYTVRTTATLNSDQTSAARLDLVYYDATYLPTKISSAGSYTVIRANTTGNQVVGTFLSTRSFTDMSRHWAQSTVALLAAKNIIDSSYGTTFKPEQKVTRAEFAVMLSRGLGLLGDRETAQRFSDVQASTQTGDYIGAAAKAGIITGNTDGTFRPNDNITREQLAIMIIRAMEYTKHPITLSGTAASALSAFKDRNKIQNAAAEFVAKAVQEGIILGMTTTEFQPQGNATRAQAAVMLQRMLGMAGFL